MLTWMRSAVSALSETDQAWILAETALRIYPFSTLSAEVSPDHAGLPVT